MNDLLTWRKEPLMGYQKVSNEWLVMFDWPIVLPNQSLSSCPFGAISLGNVPTKYDHVSSEIYWVVSWLRQNSHLYFFSLFFF